MYNSVLPQIFAPVKGRSWILDLSKLPKIVRRDTQIQKSLVRHALCAMLEEWC